MDNGRRICASSSSKIHFTLVELLVVIGIISILAGLLLPALHGALDSAYRVTCMGQIKQLSLANFLFVDDHGGKLPLAGRDQTFSKASAWTGSTIAPSKWDTYWQSRFKHLHETGYLNTTMNAWGYAAKGDILFCPGRGGRRHATRNAGRAAYPDYHIVNGSQMLMFSNTTGTGFPDTMFYHVRLDRLTPHNGVLIPLVMDETMEEGRVGDISVMPGSKWNGGYFKDSGVNHPRVDTGDFYNAADDLRSGAYSAAAGANVVFVDGSGRWLDTDAMSRQGTHEAYKLIYQWPKGAPIIGSGRDMNGDSTNSRYWFNWLPGNSGHGYWYPPSYTSPGAPRRGGLAPLPQF